MSGFSDNPSRNLSPRMTHEHAHAHGYDSDVCPSSGNYLLPPIPGVPVQDGQNELVLSLRQMVASEQSGGRQMTQSGSVTSVQPHVNSGRRLSTMSTVSTTSTAPPGYLDAVMNLQQQNYLVPGQRSSTASYSSVPPSYLDAVINSQPNIPGIHGQKIPIPSVAETVPLPRHTETEYSNEPRTARNDIGSRISTDSDVTGIDFRPNPRDQTRDATDGTGGSDGLHATKNTSDRMLFLRKLFCLLVIQFVVSSWLIGQVNLYMSSSIQNQNGLSHGKMLLSLMCLTGTLVIIITTLNVKNDWNWKNKWTNIIMAGLLTFSYGAFGAIFGVFFGSNAIFFAIGMILPVSLALLMFLSRKKRWEITYWSLSWSAFFIFTFVLMSSAGILVGVRIYHPENLPPMKHFLPVAFCFTVLAPIALTIQRDKGHRDRSRACIVV